MKKTVTESITAQGCLRIDEAATLLGVSTDLIWKKINAGELETTSLGRCRLIIRASLERLLAQRRR